MPVKLELYSDPEAPEKNGQINVAFLLEKDGHCVKLVRHAVIFFPIFVNALAENCMPPQKAYTQKRPADKNAISKIAFWAWLI